jgi:Kef-type K+ transport system membrane component KefB
MSNIIVVGFILVMALAGGHLFKRIRIPEVVGYFVVGLLMGPSFSQILNRDAVTTLEFFSEIALGLILFSIGIVFDFANLRQAGRKTAQLTVYVGAGTVLAVFLTLLPLTGSWQISLILGAIAVEVSPIATVLVLREANSEGPLTDAIYNIVALNNVVCLLVFGLATFLVRSLSEAADVTALLRVLGEEALLLVWSNVGSVALGIVLGYILAFWGKHVEEHGELLILTLGILLITVGSAHWLGVSSPIASMALGATLINIAPQSKNLFDVLGKTDPPVYAIFFVLAGAHLQLSSLMLIGLTGVGYTVARIAGKMAGAWVGAKRVGSAPVVQKYLGVTLVAHAGVAIGLALQSQTTFPMYAEVIAAVILGSVLVNEVIGPVFTKLALQKAGEVREEHPGAFQAV